jgi:hypothetical protein
MAQALSESSKAFIEGAKGVRVISNVDELTVTKEDLENLDSQVTFRGIKRLIFNSDVNWELFDSKVSSIVMCDEVVLPKSIPKLKAVEKMRFVKRITVMQQSS